MGLHFIQKFLTTATKYIYALYRQSLKIRHYLQSNYNTYSVSTQRPRTLPTIEEKWTGIHFNKYVLGLSQGSCKHEVWKKKNQSGVQGQVLSRDHLPSPHKPHSKPILAHCGVKQIIVCQELRLQA